jgi:hypothetical protein
MDFSVGSPIDFSLVLDIGVPSSDPFILLPNQRVARHRLHPGSTLGVSLREVDVTRTWLCS